MDGRGGAIPGRPSLRQHGGLAEAILLWFLLPRAESYETGLRVEAAEKKARKLA